MSDHYNEDFTFEIRKNLSDIVNLVVQDLMDRIQFFPTTKKEFYDLLYSIWRYGVNHFSKTHTFISWLWIEVKLLLLTR